MAEPRFVDTNVLLRYFVRSDPEKALAAKALLDRVERREERVVTSLLVVFETVFTLERTYKVPKSQIREMVQDVLSLAGVQLAGKGICFQALDLYVQYNVSFADAFNTVYMRARGLSEIYSWDSDFNKLPGVSRLEPAEES